MKTATFSTLIRRTHAGSISWLAPTTSSTLCQKAATKTRTRRWIGFAAMISTMPRGKARKHDHENSVGRNDCHRTNFQCAARKNLEGAHRCGGNAALVFRPEGIQARSGL